MIKWTRLQLSMLPTIAIEADHAIQKLQQLVSKVSNHARSEDIQTLNILRRSILNRIDALDKFYEINHLDSTISIFHMIKLKLKKAVFKVENIYNEQTTLQFINKKQTVSKQGLQTLTSFVYDEKKQMSKDYTSNKKSNLVNIQVKKKPKSKSAKKKNDTTNNQQFFLESYEETNLMQQPRLTFNGFHQKNNHNYSFEQGNQAINHLFKYEEQNHRSTSNNKFTKENSLTKKINYPNFKTQYKQKNIKLRKFDVPASNNISKVSEKSKLNAVDQTKLKTMESERKKINQKMPLQKNVKSKIDAKQKKINHRIKTQSINANESENIKEDEITQQFRFTIKMTKQEYQNLIKMRQILKNEKNL